MVQGQEEDRVEQGREAHTPRGGPGQGTAADVKGPQGVGEGDADKLHQIKLHDQGIVAGDADEQGVGEQAFHVGEK